MSRPWAPLALGILLVGCAPLGQPRADAADAQARVTSTRSRVTPQRVQARFQSHVRSEPLGLSGASPGALQLDRPGRGRLELFAPAGGTAVTLVADGTALAALVARDRRHLREPDADALVREATGGAAGLDDLLGLLVGDLPLDDAAVTAVTTSEAGVRGTLAGPDGLTVDLVLDPILDAPRELVARNTKGNLLLRATWEDWSAQEGLVLPGRVVLELPVVDLTLTLRFQAWSRPDALLSFETRAPPGLETEPLDGLLRRAMLALARATAE